jgi:hypothetical protein
MTEAQWSKCTDPMALLHVMEGKASDRKLRLFASSCGRLLWPQYYDERSRTAVEVSERFAEGLTDKGEMKRASTGAARAMSTAFQARQRKTRKVLDPIVNVGNLAGFACTPRAYTAAVMTARLARESLVLTQPKTSPVSAGKTICDLFRHIVGNPFHQVTMLPAWRASQRFSLAQSIYDYRRFIDMPILGDGMQKAGCTDANILNHCRQPGEHVRGCWVVDMILGKE